MESGVNCRNFDRLRSFESLTLFHIDLLLPHLRGAELEHFRTRTNVQFERWYLASAQPNFELGQGKRFKLVERQVVVDRTLYPNRQSLRSIMVKLANQVVPPRFKGQEIRIIGQFFIDLLGDDLFTVIGKLA
ncbi:MAG: hypothetical protein C0624_05555 [Desulfuromonas sp.]|nr:MAG: hypothetical protein C0624_05555 [Desulfuromonas sp.]